jgi:hypothetical protein
MTKIKSLQDLKILYDGMLDPKPLPEVPMCNCVGPKPGSTKCPCTILAEADEKLAKLDELEKTSRSGG